MWPIFLQTLPFFALVGLGYLAVRLGVFTLEANASLTRWIFLFPLSAMLFGFAANMTLAEIFDMQAAMAYTLGCFAVYFIALAVALLRRQPVADAAMEAHTAIIGNTGFLGTSMLVAILGAPASATVILVLVVDLVVFSTLLTLIITWSREGRISPQLPARLGLGLLRNPMIVSVIAGLLWSSSELSLPAPAQSFVSLLGSAATPGAMFAIGASLAAAQAARMEVAGWLSFAKLILHPLAVGIAAFWIFDLSPYTGGVLVAAAALPVAGNVYMLAQHYNVGVMRVSASILISTVLSVITVPLIIAYMFPS